jgi:hypothetical protein
VIFSEHAQRRSIRLPLPSNTVVQTPAIRIEGLTKHYGKVDALKDLDLEVARGEVWVTSGLTERGEDDDDPTSAGADPAKRRPGRESVGVGQPIVEGDEARRVIHCSSDVRNLSLRMLADSARSGNGAVPQSPAGSPLFLLSCIRGIA